MDGFELNKVAAAILVAGLIAMVSGTVSRVLYHADAPAEARGYEIEVAEVEEGAANAAAPEEAVNIGALLAAASIEEGQKIAAKQCATCHTFEQGGAAKVGPNLYGVVGNKYGAKDGFGYSKAMMEKQAEGGGWGYEELYWFLKKPAKYLKGTKMGFAGFKKKDGDTASVILYLRSLSDNPPALPAAE